MLDIIKKDELDKILEAGLWTPNARARQAVKLVVVQDSKTNDQLGKINRKTLSKQLILKQTLILKTKLFKVHFITH